MADSTPGTDGLRAARYPWRPDRPGSADLVLAGRPLPLTGAARIYTCGITPYDVTHLGHAATFVWADLLASLARAVDVRSVTSRNVTDVDDVLTAAARERSRHYDDVAVTQEFLFDRDMADLAVARPDATPRARAHVTQVVQLVEALLQLGHAYERAGAVHFRAPADLDLAGGSTEEALAALAEFGDRADDGREQPFDVPLWKPSDDGDPAWPSPWGWGRPAWHVECAAMAMTVFGSSVDVLVGGADLAFPHHAFQAAMVEAATQARPFARRTLHVGTVHAGGAKMAKSTGNLVLVRDLLADHEGAAIRLLLLDRPWAQPWEYDAGALAGAEDRLARLRRAAGGSGTADGRQRVLAALLDDLDVPTAAAVAEELGGEAARTLLAVLRLSA
jgi:L-cysteine:1D-myo-inositol 2-amino-2-deoxy-alpha-D-glucopyranoside ligase